MLFPSSSIFVHLSKHSIMFVWHDLPRTKPCCCATACGKIRLCLIKKLITVAHTIFSSILQTADVSTTGRKLPIIALEPLLCMGTIFASFHCVGTSPPSSDFLKICFGFGAISWAHSFSSLALQNRAPCWTVKICFIKYWKCWMV